MVSNFDHEGHKIIFHVLRGREICHLFLYDLGIFQVRLDVLGLEKLECLPIFYLCLCLMGFLIVEVRFYSIQG